MKPLTLNAVTQGIQRIREKGSPDAGSLYDLVNGYVAIDGSIQQRPGTELHAELPAGTIGLMAHDNELVVFSTSPKPMPAGVRCEVLAHPYFPSVGIRYIWFAAPFLGYPYVAAEFSNGDVYHYWLQAQTQWEASTMFREGQIVVPATHNGLAYKAHRVLPPNPTWAPGLEIDIGSKVEPTTANGYYYEAIKLEGASGVGTPGGSPSTPGGGGGAGDDGGSPAPSSGPATVSGNLPDGYVGVPYSNVGAYGDPWVDGGNGASGRYLTGTLWPGAGVNTMGALDDTRYAIEITGTPLVAGAYAVAPSIDAGAGAVAFPDSVTIAAKPAYAVLDFSRRSESVAHTGVSPAFTGARLAGAGIVDCAGWTAGKVYCEVVVSDVTSLHIGVHAAALDSLYVGTDRAGTTAYYVPAAGTYGIAFDTATGKLWVRDASGWIGGGDPAAGTTPTHTGPTTSTNGRFRFGFYGTGTLQANFGNAAFAYALPAGFSRVAMPTMTVPAIWRIQRQGSRHDTTRTVWSGGIASNSPEWAIATIGKSTGKWQCEISCRTVNTESVGLCVEAFDVNSGRLGQAGTANSIGVNYATSRGAAAAIHIETCLGGVHATYVHGWDYGVLGHGNLFTFAVDLSAGTVAIYANGVLLRTITGVPSGTYFPAATGGTFSAATLTATGLAWPVSGFSDWTTTL
ncbi:hypothetical protein MASR1M8_15910 [Thermomonas brevis]